MKFAKLAVAFLAGARPGIVTNIGVYAKSNVDVRLYDMKAPGGRAALWFNYAVAKGGTQTNGIAVPSPDAFGLGFRHTRTEFHGGYNEFSIGCARGAASNLAGGPDAISQAHGETATPGKLSDTAEPEVRHHAAIHL